MDQSLEEIIQQLSQKDFYRANRQFIVHYPARAKAHRYHIGKLLLELNIPIDEQIIINAEKATDFKGWLNQQRQSSFNLYETAFNRIPSIGVPGKYLPVILYL